MRKQTLFNVLSCRNIGEKDSFVYGGVEGGPGTSGLTVGGGIRLDSPTPSTDLHVEAGGLKLDSSGLAIPDASLKIAQGAVSQGAKQLEAVTFPLSLGEAKQQAIKKIEERTNGRSDDILREMERARDGIVRAKTGDEVIAIMGSLASEGVISNYAPANPAPAPAGGPVMTNPIGNAPTTGGEAAKAPNAPAAAPTAGPAAKPVEAGKKYADAWAKAIKTDGAKKELSDVGVTGINEKRTVNVKASSVLHVRDEATGKIIDRLPPKTEVTIANAQAYKIEDKVFVKVTYMKDKKEGSGYVALDYLPKKPDEEKKTEPAKSDTVAEGTKLDDRKGETEAAKPVEAKKEIAEKASLNDVKQLAYQALVSTPTKESEEKFAQAATSIEKAEKGQLVKLKNDVSQEVLQQVLTQEELKRASNVARADTIVQIKEVIPPTKDTPQSFKVKVEGIGAGKILTLGTDNFTLLTNDDMKRVASKDRVQRDSDYATDIKQAQDLRKDRFTEATFFATLKGPTQLTAYGTKTVDGQTKGFPVQAELKESEIVAVTGKLPDGRIAICTEQGVHGWVDASAINQETLAKVPAGSKTTPTEAIAFVTRPKDAPAAVAAGPTVAPTQAPAAAPAVRGGVEKAEEGVVTNLEGLSKSAGFEKATVYKKDGAYYIANGENIYELQASGVLKKMDNLHVSNLGGAISKGAFTKEGKWNPLDGLSADEARELAALGLEAKKSPDKVAAAPGEATPKKADG